MPAPVKPAMTCPLPRFIVVLIALLGISATAAAARDGEPNIIYILADDLGYGDVGYNGQQKFQTPNIDKLAGDGLVFTQHYSGNTVCAPSRCALLTGQHTGHCFVRGNKEVKPEGQHPLPASTFTLTRMLREHGYTTGVFGKWGLGFPGSEGDPMNQGVDVFYGYNCQRLAHHYYPRYLWDNHRKHVLDGNQGRNKGQFAPHLIHDRALAFIEQNKDQPFFLFYATPLPHAELVAPEEEMAKFRGKLNPETPFEGCDDGPEYRLGGYESQAEPHAAFAAMVTIFDRQLGELRAKVEQLGLADNTLIIFSSDNGPHQEGGADPDYFDSNGPLRGYKRDLYEGGIRVPTVAWGPKLVKPGTTDHISAFWDLLPTVAEMVGAELPGNIDGVSFLPTLKGDAGSQKQHPYLYWEFHERGGRQAIRKGKWKAVKYDVLKKGGGKTQLYDLSSDVGEDHDLAAEHPEIVSDMERIFQSARTPSDIFTFASKQFKGQ